MALVTGPAGRARSLEENRDWLRARLAARIHPLDFCDPDETLRVIDALPALDGATWGRAWTEAGDRAAEAARAHERRGNTAAAADGFGRAHGLYFLGRFPTPNHPAKEAAAVLERAAYLDAARTGGSDMQRIAVPFDGRPGEGREVVFYYRRPLGVERPPVVALWGGIDAWKEQLTNQVNAFLQAGVATLALDTPGTGESPVVASPDAERQFLPVFDWARTQPDLDGTRIGCFGRSFGGYWATKLAHLYPERIAGAVSWAGGAHYMYQREWVEANRYPDSYLMDLSEARGRMLGATNDTEYLERFAALSLLDQGILERPCAPLLLVNGKDDRQCPIDDIYVLLEHGSPKSVRFFPGGHMGHGPRTLPTMVEWLKSQLARRSP